MRGLTAFAFHGGQRTIFTAALALAIHGPMAIHSCATSSADKVLGSSSDSQNLCTSSPSGEAAFVVSPQSSDNRAATFEAALCEAVTSALATAGRCVVPSGYRLRQ